jgi:peroxiredoxin
VQFVGVAWAGDDASMQAFVDRHGLTFPQVNDDAGEVFARFNVPYQPAWAFVDAAGEVEVVHGALGEEDLAAKVQALAAG